MIKKAMILAAGFGKRLQPLTINCPKPLLKIGNETLLSNTLRFLEKTSVTHVVINVHYLGDQIINYTNKNKFNLEITLVNEKDKILDTGGGVLNVVKYFSNEPFLVINPDTIWNSRYLGELKFMETSLTENKKSKCIYSSRRNDWLKELSSTTFLSKVGILVPPGATWCHFGGTRPNIISTVVPYVYLSHTTNISTSIIPKQLG